MLPRLPKGTPGMSKQVWACQGMPGQTQPKAAASHATFPTWISPCKKSKESDALLPKILMIKKSCNLIG